MMAVVYIGSLVLSMSLPLLVCYISGYPLMLIIALVISALPNSLEYIIFVVVFWFCMVFMGYQQYYRMMNEFALQVKNEELIHQLKESNIVAQQATEAKSRFLANMSHEIRTPMNGILGLTRLVLGMELGKEQHRLLSNALYSAENLLEILNDILDFSKIEAGQLSLDLHDFNFVTMLENLTSSFAFQVEDKGIYIQNKTDFILVPHYICADELRIRQVLINLIGNAIKFTRQGGVTIEIKVLEQVEQKITLYFSVTDTGIGLSPEAKKTIFESFAQADSSTSREFGGTGLGLTISRQLIEMMGGSLEVESEKGQGCHFYFTLIVSQAEEVKEQNSIKESASKHSNLRILLVEDDKINQMVASIILKQDAQQVNIANNGIEALEILAYQEFDLILMDMQMPKMDGLMTTSIIRRCEKNDSSNQLIPDKIKENLLDKLKNKHIPIIAMTANVLDSDREKCQQAGMDDFLNKPFAMEELYAALNKLNF
jgi:two-component system, sensor histidine kinase